MNIAEIESSLKDLVETPFDAGTFIFHFLEIYDAPKATVTKLRQGTTNHAKEPGELLWKNKLFFRVAEKGQAAMSVDAMADDPLAKKHAPRIFLATDGEEVYCRDVKADQTCDTSFDKLNDIFDFFLPLAGIERYEGVAENDPHIRNGKRNARLRLIFENGTEGKNLLRSLATELYKDPSGRRLSEPNAGPLFDPAPTTATVVGPNGHGKVTTLIDENARFPHPNPLPQAGEGANESLRELQVNERITGCIYIVRSLSPSPEIAKLDGQLFKIGFTTASFEDRIRGAKDDPTFLMAPVYPVRTYDAINLNANKFESLMHRFFADARLDIEIMDRFGKPFRPREWFLLPLPVIEAAIVMLLDGTILRHRYDAVACEIVSVQAQWLG